MVLTEGSAFISHDPPTKVWPLEAFWWPGGRAGGWPSAATPSGEVMHKQAFDCLKEPTGYKV